MGHVFWYTVEGKGYSLRDLRSLQDWFIRYQLNAVPGVAEVASVGGVVRQYQIDVDPNRLRAFRIPLSAVVEAVMRSNRNVGGNVVEAQRHLVGGPRARADRARRATSSRSSSAPRTACRSSCARSPTVKIGDAFRAARSIKGTEEAVGGVVVARYGVSTIDVIKRVKEKIAAAQAGLPPGVRIVPFYDRSELIERAVDTLKRALIEETIVVTLVQHRLPAPLPLDPDRDDPAAAGRPHLVPLHALSRDQRRTSCRWPGSPSPSACWWTRPSW